MTPRADLIARLDYWEGVLRIATPGKWFAWFSVDKGCWTVQEPRGWIAELLPERPNQEANAALIVAMRAMMEPALAAAREDLKAHKGIASDETICAYCSVDCGCTTYKAKLADCPVIQKWRGIIPEPPQ